MQITETHNSSDGAAVVEGEWRLTEESLSCSAIPVSVEYVVDLYPFVTRIQELH